MTQTVTGASALLLLFWSLLLENQVNCPIPIQILTAQKGIFLLFPFPSFFFPFSGFQVFQNIINVLFLIISPLLLEDMRVDLRRILFVVYFRQLAIEIHADFGVIEKNGFVLADGAFRK